MPATPILKVLTRAGIGPRRWAADAIREGRVQVNGETVTGFHHPVGDDDRISIDGRPLTIKPPGMVYIMLNKPRGIFSTTHDERGRKTVIDLLPVQYARLALHPVGRLDKDSTGLLLLTNDGDLTYRLTHPSFEHEKEYLVRVEPALRPGEKVKLEEGLELDDGVTHRASVRPVKEGPFNYSIAIHEGRKRQVRRMFEKIGHRVLALKRVRMGTLRLGDLGEGEVRELTVEEVRALVSEEAALPFEPV
jgi:23S rRNA pseudouridine2605 synthase